MVDIPYYVDGMARYNYGVIKEVEGMAEREPARCAAILHDFLEHGLPRDDSNLAWLAIELLYRADARGTDEWLLSGWRRFSEVTRRNIASTTSNPNAISTSVALMLFDSAESTVCDRHVLFGGLMQSYRARDCRDALIARAGRIGRYDDPSSQAILDGFLGSVKLQLGLP